MEAILEKIENSEAYIEIIVDEEIVENGLQQAYKKIVKKVNVPGFRKGKAPRAILTSYYGKEILYSDAFEIIVPQAYEEALKKLEIDPIASPEFDFPDEELKADFRFKAVVPVKPEVTLGDLDGIEVIIPKIDLEDIDVTSAIKEIQNKYTEVAEKDSDPAEWDDKVTIDFEGFTDDVPFEGGKGEDYQLVLGSNTFIPGFEDQLIGLKKGEEKEIKVWFPEKYHNEELAGKDAIFKVLVKKIETKIVRELTDEFAQEVSEFDTIEEFRADLKEKAIQKIEEQKKLMIRNEAVKLATERCSMIIPEGAVNDHVNKTLQQLEQSMSMQLLTIEDYFKYTNTTEDEFRKRAAEEALMNLKADFMLDKIANIKGYEVSDEEIDKYIENMAVDVKMTPERTRELLEPNMDKVKHSLKLDKAVDYLAENAIVIEKEFDQEEAADEAELIEE